MLGVPGEARVQQEEHRGLPACLLSSEFAQRTSPQSAWRQL